MLNRLRWLPKDNQMDLTKIIPNINENINVEYDRYTDIPYITLNINSNSNSDRIFLKSSESSLIRDVEILNDFLIFKSPLINSSHRYKPYHIYYELIILIINTYEREKYDDSKVFEYDNIFYYLDEFNKGILFKRKNKSYQMECMLKGFLLLDYVFSSHSIIYSSDDKIIFTTTLLKSKYEEFSLRVELSYNRLGFTKLTKIEWVDTFKNKLTASIISYFNEQDIKIVKYGTLVESELYRLKEFLSKYHSNATYWGYLENYPILLTHQIFYDTLNTVRDINYNSVYTELSHLHKARIFTKFIPIDIHLKVITTDEVDKIILNVMYKDEKIYSKSESSSSYINILNSNLTELLYLINDSENEDEAIKKLNQIGEI